MLDIQEWRRAMYAEFCRQGRYGKGLKALRGLLCEATTRLGRPCIAPGLGRGGRCKRHGGMSSGAKTVEGKQRQRDGTTAYWQRMRELGIKRTATPESREANRQGQVRRWAEHRARKRREAILAKYRASISPPP